MLVTSSLASINSSPLSEMAVISQTKFSYVFSFDYYFTECCSYGSNWQLHRIGLDNGLAPNRRQAIIWTNADPILWRIYAALGGDELSGPRRPYIFRTFSAHAKTFLKFE